jgi:dephospho-CoA kinase
LKIIALTGSIGMGKTTTSAMFKDLGVPVWDADGAVHRLYASGGAAVAPVGAAFPEALTKEGAIDRDILGRAVLGNSDKLLTLEAIVHPLVGQDRAKFVADAQAQKSSMTVVDVPLLYETSGEKFVDKVIVVSCHPDLQRARVMARPGMSEAKFASILARQIPDAQKRARADFMITTDESLDSTREQVAKIYQQIMVLEPVFDGESKDGHRTHM